MEGGRLDARAVVRRARRSEEVAHAPVELGRVVIPRAGVDEAVPVRPVGYRSGLGDGVDLSVADGDAG